MGRLPGLRQRRAASSARSTTPGTANPRRSRHSPADDDQFRQPLGADADVFRLQVEDLARAATTGSAPRGATAADGLASVRAMVALARSVESGDWVRLADVTGGL